MAENPAEKAFLEAAEIAGKLPKHLQEIAFNRALDHLLGQTPGAVRGSGRAAAAPAVNTTGESDLIGRIDRTKYPDIGATSRVADRALKVLQLANDDLGVDGLTAVEISEVLTRRFRLPVTPNAVNIALERETNTVDIRTSGGMKRFHIMAPGDDYLKALRSGEAINRLRRPASKQRPSADVSADDAKTRGRAKKASPANGSVRRGPSRPGPKAAVTQLIQTGFFKTPRTIAAVQEELKHSRGHTFSLQELAPALVRSIRDESLRRNRDAQGQYEYSNK